MKPLPIIVSLSLALASALLISAMSGPAWLIVGIAASFGLGGIIFGLLRVEQTKPAVEPAPEPAAAPESATDTTLLSDIIDSMEGGVMTISSEGIITSFNAVAQKTLGYDLRAVGGKHYGEVLAGPGNKTLLEMIESALLKNETYSSAEVNAATAGGATVPLGVTVSHLRGTSGSSRGIVLTFKNLAELKRIREQVQRTDQLASLGRLSAGMAHEIRNPLGSLHGLVELIQEDFDPTDPKRRYTSTMLKTISKLDTLVENLLDFAQPVATHFELNDLRDIVNECVEMCELEFRGRVIDLREDYDEQHVPVMADREALARAITNIVRNAFQATPDGGGIYITVVREHETNGSTGDAVATVANTGSFIKPEDKARLFTPFFTTRSDGTGLGLSIANQTLAAHSGQIEVRSEPESGTVFQIRLPAADTIGEQANTETEAFTYG